MIGYDSMLIDNVLRVLDNPDRVQTPAQHCRTAPERKPLSEYPEIEQRRQIDFWIAHHKHRDAILDDVSVDIDMRELLKNFAAGDDAANGQVIKRLFMRLRDQIDREEE